MNAKERFQGAAQEWADHCKRVRFSSSLPKYLDHPSFRQLVQLGPEIIPDIIEAYGSDDLPWGFVLQEITGLRMIPDPDAFSPAELRKRWLTWWQERQEQSTGATPPIDRIPEPAESSFHP
jgi:hypothetical protein